MHPSHVDDPQLEGRICIIKLVWVSDLCGIQIHIHIIQYGRASIFYMPRYFIGHPQILVLANTQESYRQDPWDAVMTSTSTKANSSKVLSLPPH